MDQAEREHIASVLDVLYGDGAWEISKKLTEKQKYEYGRKVGYVTNLAGAVAGPAAIAMAIKGRKGGGIPRSVGHSIGGKAGRIATKLDNPQTTGWKRGAKAAGASLIGLQTVNWVGDAVAAKTLHEPKKKIAKSEKNLTAAKYRLVKKGVVLAGEGAKQAPKISGKTMAAVQQAPELAQRAVHTVKKDVDFSIRGEVSKMNEELKQVFGWASVIEVNGEPVIDLQGDVMTIDTIEKAAYTYVNTSRKGGKQHARAGDEPLQVSDMIESFVLTPEKKTQMGIPDNVPTGWWVGFQINDDETWKDYKDGKLKEFSIHGSGTRKALEL